MVDCIAECCVHMCVYICADLICTACIGAMCIKCRKKKEVSTETPYSALGMVTPYNSGPTVFNEDDKKVAGVTYHTVAPGETCYMITRKYNVTRESLYTANGVKGDESLVNLGTIIIPSDSPTPV